MGILQSVLAEIFNRRGDCAESVGPSFPSVRTYYSSRGGGDGTRQGGGVRGGEREHGIDRSKKPLFQMFMMNGQSGIMNTS